MNLVVMVFNLINKDLLNMYFEPHTILRFRDTVVKLRKQKSLYELEGTDTKEHKTIRQDNSRNKITENLWDNKYQKISQKLDTTIEITLL